MAAEALQTRVDMGDIKGLDPLAKRLNAATEELNQSLQTIQDKLNEQSIGVEVWLDSPALHTTDWRQVIGADDEPTGAREYTAQELGYGRIGDGWSLIVRTRRYVELNRDLEPYDDGDDRKPLLRSARHLRIEAVKLIPKLIDAIAAEANKALKSIEHAKKIADSLE